MPQCIGPDRFLRNPGRVGLGRLAVAVALLSQPALAAVDSGASEPVERTITVQAYDISGNSLLPREAMETAVYPYLGPDKGLRDIDGARNALERVYHDRGYQSVVVEVPRQSGADGIIKLQVVEAPVGRLRVTGSRYYSIDVIKDQIPALREGAVPNINAVQTQMVELNRLPNRQITPLLKPGKVPGTIDVELKVQDKFPVHATLELNNNHSPDTTALRAQGSVQLSNLWQRGHSLTATYQVAPQRRGDSEVFSGSYLAPIWGTPWNLLAFGYKSNSNIAALGGSTVLGKGYALGLRMMYQLPQSGAFSQSLGFGFDYKDFKENISVAGTLTEAPVKYLPAVVTYSLQHVGTQTLFSLQTSLTAGLRGIGSDEATFQNKRAYASGSFVHLNGEASLTYSFWRDAQALFKVAGQLADRPLASAEQFSAGGLDSVRGYLASEVVGDNGVSGTLELATPNFGPRISPVIDAWRFVVFADLGYVHVTRALAEQEADFTIASLGVGHRLDLLGHLSGELMVGFPLKDSTSTKTGHAFGTFSVKTEF